MHHKTKKNGPAINLESENDRHEESIISTSPDKKNADSTGERPMDAALSEEFFLSDFPDE